MRIDCYDLVGTTDVKIAGTAHQPWVSHHLLSFCIDPGDQPGLGDLYDPVAASLNKVTVAYGRAWTHTAEFK